MERVRLVWRVLAVGLLLSGVVVGASPATDASATGGVGAVPASRGNSVSYGGGDLQALEPARILDTRKGTGAPKKTVGTGEVLSVKVTGVGGVPAIGVGAVVLNLTGISPTAPTYLTAWPHGAARPVASNLNLKTGEVRPNMVVVKVGRGGMVDLYNYNGQVDLAADVSGWFSVASGLQPLVPARILDTRKGIGAPTAKIGSQGTLGLQVVGRGGVPAEGVGAVVLNLTGISPSSETYLTAWPAGATRPVASNLNLNRGDVAPNLVVVKVGAQGRINLFNNLGEIDVAADVVGWFPVGSAYEPVNPARILDTRSGLGAPARPLGNSSTIALKVTGQGGVPVDDVGAVVLNLTGITPSAPQTYITASPTGAARPVASNLNLNRGTVVPNLVVAKVGAGGSIDLYNYAGETHLAADVVGWFPTGGDALTTITPAVGTVLVGPGDIAAVTGDAETGGTVTFAASSDTPAAGGHFAYPGSNGTGGGLSGTVTATTTNPDGTAVVAYEPANLQDIFTDLEIHQPTGTGAAAGAPGAPAGAARAEQHLSAARVDCSVNAEPVAVPTVEFGSFSGEADFSLRPLSARIMIGGTLTLGWDVAVTGAVSCGVTLAKGPLGWIGPVEVGWEVGTSISISEQATATTTVSVPINVGFQYDGGQATNLSNADLVGVAEGNGNAEISAGFAGSIGTKLFGVLGVRTSLSPALNVTLTSSEDNPAQTCVSLSADIGVGIAAEVKKWGVGWQFSIAGTTLAEKTLYTTPNCTETHWVGTITVDDTWESRCTDPLECSLGYETQKDTTQGTYILGGYIDGPMDEERYLATVDSTHTVHSFYTYESGGCTWSSDLRSTTAFVGAVRRALTLRQVGSDWLINGLALWPEPETPEESGSAAAVGRHTEVQCDVTHTEDTDMPLASTRSPKSSYIADDSFDAILMSDQDPDPNHLVGTTDKVAHGPGNTAEIWETETITITYDLRRVPVT